MIKYNFSEIKRFENYGYNRKQNLVGKYGSQVFDKNGNYITCLVGNSYKEVAKMQKDLLDNLKEVE